MPDQDLRLQWQSEGADAVKRDAADVQAAQEKITQSVKADTGAKKEQDATQKKLNASAGDWGEILARINPTLGAMVTSGEKAVKILGDLASTNFSLRDATDLVARSIRNFASSLKLLFAAGALAAGIGLLVAVFTKIADAAKAAEDAIRRVTGVMNENDEAARKAADRVAEEAVKRRQPLTAEQRQSIEATLRKAPPERREAIGDLLERFGGGAKGFGPKAGQLDLTGREIDLLGRLGFQPIEGAGRETERRRAPRFLQRRQDEIRETEEADRETRKRRENRAVEQFRDLSTGRPTSTGDLRRVTDEIARRHGIDPDEFQRMLLNPPDPDPFGGPPLITPAPNVDPTTRVRVKDAGVFRRMFGTDVRDASGRETVALREAMQALRITIEHLGPPIIQNNPRNIYPSKAAQDAARQNAVRRMERTLN